MIPELDAVPQSTSLLVRFGLHPVLNPLKTNGGTIIENGKEVVIPAAGRPIFDDVEYIEIRIPGQKDTVHRPVREHDKHEFALQYAKWKANAASGGEIGTLLSTVPFLTKGQVLELEHFGCKTVEQLAGMSDSAAQNIGPILSLRTKAQNYLLAAKGNAPLAQMEAKAQAQAEELDLLKRQMAELLAASKQSSEKQTAKSK